MLLTLGFKLCALFSTSRVDGIALDGNNSNKKNKVGLHLVHSFLLFRVTCALYEFKTHVCNIMSLKKTKTDLLNMSVLMLLVRGRVYRCYKEVTLFALFTWICQDLSD